MLDEKAKGREIKPVPAPERRGQVIDLMQALKQSLEKSRPRKKATTGQKKRESLDSLTGQALIHDQL
jgi:non-homologous end joining protein Ku